MLLLLRFIAAVVGVAFASNLLIYYLLPIGPIFRTALVVLLTGVAFASNFLIYYFLPLSPVFRAALVSLLTVCAFMPFLCSVNGVLDKLVSDFQLFGGKDN